MVFCEVPFFSCWSVRPWQAQRRKLIRKRMQNGVRIVYSGKPQGTLERNRAKERKSKRQRQGNAKTEEEKNKENNPTKTKTKTATHETESTKQDSSVVREPVCKNSVNSVVSALPYQTRPFLRREQPYLKILLLVTGVSGGGRYKEKKQQPKQQNSQHSNCHDRHGFLLDGCQDSAAAQVKQDDSKDDDPSARGSSRVRIAAF
jgi:hypothetical protein